MCKKEKGPKGPIINEMLCFVTNKFNVLDPNFLIKLCKEKYKPKEIEKAKQLVFDLLTSEDDPTKFKKRNHSKTSDDKPTKDINDIFQLLQEKGTKQWPQFVALDLSKLPPISFDSMDVSVLLTTLQRVYADVEMLREGLDTQCKVSDSLIIANKKLQNRVIQIEGKGVGSVTCDIALPGESIKRSRNEIPLECTDSDVVSDEISTSSLGNTGPKVNKDEKSKSDNSETESDSEDSESVSEIRPFSCTKCDFTFEEKADLVSHTSSCQELDENKIENINESNSKFKDEQKQSSGDDVQLQMFECTECDFKFVTIDGLYAHFVEHKAKTSPNFVCAECRKNFISEEELNQHKKTHTQPKIFTCSECDYENASKEIMRSHTRIHFGEKPV